MNPTSLLPILFKHSQRHFSACPVHHQLDAFTRRLFKLPPRPSAPSHHHNDLSSFLAYAHRTALSPTSTSHIGTHYEYTVQQTLRRSAFDLHRIGGRDDAGIDLVGTWHLPQHEHPLRVFVQCKAFKTKLGPNVVRELEGTFRQAAPVGWRGDGEAKVGVLVGPREATRGVRDAMARSAWPVLWLMVEREGGLRQALWNARVEELGLGALGVEMVYGDGLRKGIGLTWDGCELPSMDQVEERMARLQADWLQRWEAGADVPTSRREELLDLVQRLYPDEKPLLCGTDLGRSTLTEADRAKVLQLLRDKAPSSVEEP